MNDEWDFDGELMLASDHDEVGTVDVQVLLSWYFDDADDGELDILSLRDAI